MIAQSRNGRRRSHVAEGTDRVLAVLKSPPYGDPAAERRLPYRVDLLAEQGFVLRWTDEPSYSRLGRTIRRFERRLVPLAQAWEGRRHRRRAVATLAMFESEGHGLALWRTLTGRRHPPLVIVACWLTDLAGASRTRRLLYRALYRSVDRIVVFSDNQRAPLAALLRVPIERIATVRFGVDLDELATVRTVDGDRVVAVGRDLGRDWATLAAASRCTGWDVELVTRTQQVAGLDLPPEIRHRRHVDRSDYLRLLADAAIVVVPTEVRPYPSGQTVLLEAMALGKACVVTDTPALREYVRDGENALMVPPHDAGALRAAVQRLLDEPDLRRSVGSAARRDQAAGGGAAMMWSRLADVVDETVRQRTRS